MRILIFILILFSSIKSSSQELKVSLDKNPALTNEIIQLQFSINAKGNDFIPPSLSNFHILNGPSQGFSQSYSNINGKTTEEIKTTISYNIQAKKDGRYIIGPASVKVNNKTIKSKSVEIVIEKSTIKENKIINNEKHVFIKLQINKSEIFIGEQISAISRIYIKNGVNLQNTEISPIKYDGFWEEEIEIKTNKKEREIINGIAYDVIKFRHSVLTAQKSGDIIIPASEMEVSIAVRGKLIGYDFFNRPQYQKILKSESINSRPRKIKVKELPRPKPKHFYGTVSEKFTISSEIDKTNLTTSEAISFKLTLRGEGNINMLDPFKIEFPSSFEVFEPIITDKTYVGNNNTGGTKTFEYILIPRKKGDFTIPEIKFSYFNPKTEKYIELNTKEHLISVKKDIEVDQEEALDNNLLEEDPVEEVKEEEEEEEEEEEKSSSIWDSIAIWIVLAIIIISYLVYFILSKRSVNTKKSRRRKSTKIAIKRLKNASFCLKNGNFDQFFEEIEKSLWGYFADKFKVNSSELSKETIDLYFNKRNVKTETKNNFISLLNICEFARYSPSKDRNLQMEKTLENAKEIIIEVESDMKKKAYKDNTKSNK